MPQKHSWDMNNWGLFYFIKMSYFVGMDIRNHFIETKYWLKKNLSISEKKSIFQLSLFSDQDIAFFSDFFFISNIRNSKKKSFHFF
jgi:hypothetical protein